MIVLIPPFLRRRFRFELCLNRGATVSPILHFPEQTKGPSGTRAVTVYEVSISACPLFEYETVYVNTPPGGCGWPGSGETEIDTATTGMFVVVTATAL